VRAVGFFEQPEKDTEFATDTGESVLRISIDGRNESFTIAIGVKLYQLTEFLDRIVRQASGDDEP